jgi:glycerol-3-phosphate cytidylyltransferase-like family protein
MSQTNGKGLRVVYTAGVFDLLHRGISTSSGPAASLGTCSSSASFRTRAWWPTSTGRPSRDVQLRMARLARLPFVDVIDIQPTTDPTPMLERYRPDVFTHADGKATGPRSGSGWRTRTSITWICPYLGDHRVRGLPYTPGVSTTLLRQRAGV